MSAKRKLPIKDQSEPASDDASYVAHYLAVMRTDAPAEVARLAAQMARDGSDFDPALFVSRAIALRQHAEATVLNRRRSLVANATILNLHALHYHLGKLGDTEAGQQGVTG